MVIFKNLIQDTNFARYKHTKRYKHKKFSYSYLTFFYPCPTFPKRFPIISPTIPYLCRNFHLSIFNKDSTRTAQHPYLPL